jgi:hypothetical protein
MTSTSSSVTADVTSSRSPRAVFEKGTQERKKPRVLLDIVDEDSGIYGDAARAERA